jgi:hypothetical protein
MFSTSGLITRCVSIRRYQRGGSFHDHGGGNQKPDGLNTFRCQGMPSQPDLVVAPPSDAGVLQGANKTNITVTNTVAAEGKGASLRWTGVS